MQAEKIVQGLGRSWHWPAADTECLKVIFSCIGDLAAAVRYCKQTRVAVQAGGNMGVWAWALAQTFENVVTFEPDPDCFELLTRNIVGARGISAYPCGLWDEPGFCSMVREERNHGAQYIAPSPDAAIELMALDTLELGYCDLVYLDIEGAELKALQGAKRTIERCHPVIAIEDKGLSARFASRMGDAEVWLAAFGYRVAERRHRDVILTCG